MEKDKMETKKDQDVLILNFTVDPVNLAKVVQAFNILMEPVLEVDVFVIQTICGIIKTKFVQHVQLQDVQFLMKTKDLEEEDIIDKIPMLINAQLINFIIETLLVAQVVGRSKIQMELLTDTGAIVIKTINGIIKLTLALVVQLKDVTREIKDHKTEEMVKAKGEAKVKTEEMAIEEDKTTENYKLLISSIKFMLKINYYMILE